MSKQIRLSQISHKNYALSLKNLQWSQCSSLISIIKKYGGRWNPSILQFQFPFIHTSDLIRQIKQLDERLVIKDIPFNLLKNLFQQNQNDDLDKKVVYLTPRNKWNRFLLLDYLLVLRYGFVGRFAGNGRGQVTTKQPFKRMLLMCSQRMMKKWVRDCFQKFKISCKQADYQSLMPEQSYRIGNVPLYETQVDILTYQKLENVAITKKVLEKYHTLICDDSDIWLDKTNSIYSSRDLGAYMEKIIKENYSHQKDLIIVCSKIPIQKSTEMLGIANLIKSKQFGTDVFRIGRNQCSDALWMKKRYVKENKYGRELLYILQSSFFINLAEDRKEIIDSFNAIDKITYEADSQSKSMINSLSIRFKHVDYRAALKNFQSERSKNSYSLGQSSKLDEGRYIKQLRQIMLIDKFSALTKYIYHLTKELSHRIALVIENQQALERVEKFLVEQQIGYVVYDITMEELRKGKSYLKFNLNYGCKVCILVREKLVQEYRKCELEREKEMEEEMLAQAEAELGVQKGSCFQLAHHYRDRFNNPLFKSRPLLQIPRITTIHHLVHFDTFWFDFSAEKQGIIDKIVSQQCLFYSQISKTQEEQSGLQGEELTSIPIINHYFICENSLQLSILQKYLANKKVHEQEMLQQDKEGSRPNLQGFQKELSILHQSKSGNSEVIDDVYDIDEQFDRLQFQAMKQKEKESLEDSLPRYNNYIQGLIPQTVCLKIQPLSKKIEQEKSPFKFQLKQRQQLINTEEIEWLSQAQANNHKQQSQSQYQSSSAESIDLKEYLIDHRVNKQISNHFLERAEKIAKQKVKETRQNLGSSDDSMPSLHLDGEQSDQFQATIKKQPIIKRKLEIKDTPKLEKVIDLLDDEEMLPLPIVGRTEHVRTKVAKYRSHSIKKPQSNYKIQRGPPTTGIKLWGKRSKQQKEIAKKYMDIKVRLSSYRSSLKQA